VLHRARDRYPFDKLQSRFPFSEAGITEAIESAMAMRVVKATIVPNADLN